MGRSLVRGSLRRRPCHCERSSRWPAPPPVSCICSIPTPAPTAARWCAQCRALATVGGALFAVWGRGQLDDLVEALAALAQR